jgi:hypothetical protein
MPMFKAVAQEHFRRKLPFDSVECELLNTVQFEAKDLSEFLIKLKAKFPNDRVGSVYLMELSPFGWSAADIVGYRLGPCVFAGFEQEPTNEQPNP